MDLAAVDWRVEAMGTWPLPLKITTIVSVFMLSLLIGFYTLISSQSNSLEQAQQKEEALKTTLNTKQKGMPPSVHKKQLKRLNASFAHMIQKIPENIEISDLLNEVLKTGNDSQLKFNFFKSLNTIKQTLYAELPISLQVIGTYREMSMFINHLLSLPYMVTMHDIAIATASAYKPSTLLTMDMTIKVYTREAIIKSTTDTIS